jgi:autoinducer 2-degrading protein
MSYTFIARMKVHPHKIAQFVAACEKMERAVADHEPDALVYKFYRLREPNAFAVIESFRTEAADAAHQASAHFKEIAPGMIECIDGGWTREFLDPLK